MPRKHKRGPKTRLETRCPMCGQTLGRGRTLWSGGAPALVWRTYAGPGRIRERPLPDAEAAREAPDWFEFVRRRVRDLADRFGLLLDEVERALARVDRTFDAAVRDLAPRARIVTTAQATAAPPTSVTWEEQGAPARTRPPASIKWEERE